MELDVAENDSQYCDVCHPGFAKFWSFLMWPFSKSHFIEIGWYMVKIQNNDFQNGSRPTSWFFFLNCHSAHVAYVAMRFPILSPKFTFIGQYGAEIIRKMISNIASVRHIRFILTCPYWKSKYVTLLYVCYLRGRTPSVDSLRFLVLIFTWRTCALLSWPLCVHVKATCIDILLLQRRYRSM